MLHVYTFELYHKESNLETCFIIFLSTYFTMASQPIPLSAATVVERLDSHVYRANLADSFCIGTGEFDISVSTRGHFSWK